MLMEANVPMSDAVSPVPSDLSLAASLFSSRGKLAVRVIALSDAGATIDAPEPPPCDSFAYLVRNGIKLPVLIAWADDGRLGLRFEAPFADSRRKAAFRASQSRAHSKAIAHHKTAIITDASRPLQGHDAPGAEARSG